MELHHFKWPHPAVVDGWRVHPLSQPHYEQAVRDTEVWAEAVSAAPWAAHLEMCLQVVARATNVDVDDIRTLSVQEAIALVRAWARAQQQSLPDAARLEAILRLGVLDDPSTEIEGAQAFHAPTASEFYGLPLVQLTIGQLLYYWTLRTVYREMHVEKDGKRYNRRWLEQQAAKARNQS